MQNDLTTLIERAKEKVMRSYGHSVGRRWLNTYCDSYEDSSYRVEIFVLEGSPVKGVVLVDHGRNVVMGFDVGGKRVFHETR